MSTLDEWVDDPGGTELGVDPAVVDRTLLLDVARDAAHGVARPAAPLTTFLVGYAAGLHGGGAAGGGRRGGRPRRAARRAPTPVGARQTISSSPA